MDENKIIFIVFLSISIISASLITIFFLVFPSIRKFPFNLIFHLCLNSVISDSFYLTNELTSAYIPSPLCHLFGWGDSFFGMQCYAYGTMIAIVLISKTFRSSFDFDKHVGWLHLISFFVNISLSIIPFCFQKYGRDDDKHFSSCWIQEMEFQIVGYYFIIWVEMLVVLVGYIKLVHFYRKVLKRQENSTVILEQYNNAKTLLFYPLIMLVVVIYRSIYRFHMEKDDEENVGVTIMATVLGNSTGTFAVLVFGCTGVIKETLRQKLKKITHPNKQTYSEENSGDVGNLESVLRVRDLEPEDAWVNLDRNQIERDIENSLGNSLN